MITIKRQIEHGHVRLVCTARVQVDRLWLADSIYIDQSLKFAIAARKINMRMRVQTDRLESLDVAESGNEQRNLRGLSSPGAVALAGCSQAQGMFVLTTHSDWRKLGDRRCL